MSSRLATALSTLCASLFAIACGSSDTPAIEGANGNGQLNPDLAADDPIGTNAACVTLKKNATLPPVNLVLMMDKSGSMGDPAEGGDPKVKWLPVTQGIKSFFADPKSGGYNASLQFFPAPGDLNTTCSAPYEKPLVDLTPLSSSAPLVAALDKASPQGGTPTLPALKGALAFATKNAKAKPDEKTVVVLVTDGEPGLMVNGQFAEGCSNNDIPHVAQAAADAFKASISIPTYVIGVGPSLSKMDQVAAAGGTGKAMLISVSDPSATAAEFQHALESIRSAVKLDCDFPLPESPSGQKIDVRRVNIAIETSGKSTPLVYSKDCTTQNGWHYDNLDAPTRIELCTQSCNQAQSDNEGKLTVAFGCSTVGIPK